MAEDKYKLTPFLDLAVGWIDEWKLNLGLVLSSKKSMF
jgi:hypothetical protein